MENLDNINDKNNKVRKIIFIFLFLPICVMIVKTKMNGKLEKMLIEI